MECFEIGEMWDAEEIDRTLAVVKAGLPGILITYSWLYIPWVQRQKLCRVIKKMIKDFGKK